jgi:hypothetical protein
VRPVRQLADVDAGLVFMKARIGNSAITAPANIEFLALLVLLTNNKLKSLNLKKRF